MAILESTHQPLRDLPNGGRVDRVLLVRAVDRRHTRNGDVFLRLLLADRSGALPGVLWADRDVAIGGPLQVTARLTDHERYGRQLRIEKVDAADAEQVDWSLLVDGPSRSVTDLERDLQSLLEQIGDPYLAALMGRLIGPDSPSARIYRDAPAAKYNHHAYVHGLLDHSVAVAQLAAVAADLFPGVDRDLVVCGALLHDLGKLEAYTSHNGCSDLTDSGKLAGEIPLGYYRIRSEIDSLPGFPPDRATALLHIVLAHHGRLEHGSPVVPQTREATIVHALDNLSGQLGAFDRLEKETAACERWSRYDRVLGACAFLA